MTVRMIESMEPPRDSRESRPHLEMAWRIALR